MKEPTEEVANDQPEVKSEPKKKEAPIGLDETQKNKCQTTRQISKVSKMR